MLALIKKSDHSVLKEVLAGSSFTIGNDITSPAYAGWDNGTYMLREILPADPIPVGYVGVSQSIIVNNNTPKYVWNTAAKIPTPDEVNAERDKRIATGFMFMGKSFAMDGESKARIIGAATLAGFAVTAGAQAGNYRWHGGSSDFVWIADDNSLNRMDAQTCFAFGQAAPAWETRLIFAARAIRHSSPVRGDYTNNDLWPVSGS